MRAWSVILIVTGSVLVFAFSVLVQGSPATDPFSPYADLLSKDHVIAGMRDRKFSCVEIFPEPQQACLFEPEDDVLFSRIHLSILRGIPQSIAFEVKDDALHVGDLILLWDKPDTIFPYASSTLLWSEHDGVTATAFVPSEDRLNYLAPVWVVSFTF